jgi:DNA-binding protein HU-beta
MLKHNIVSLVSNDTGYSKHEVDTIVDSFLMNITWALSNGREVKFPGFGTFKPKKRAARTGRNPHTGDKVPIPARIMPVFVAGESLKNAVKKELESKGGCGNGLEKCLGKSKDRS